MPDPFSISLPTFSNPFAPPTSSSSQTPSSTSSSVQSTSSSTASSTPSSSSSSTTTSSSIPSSSSSPTSSTSQTTSRSSSTSSVPSTTASSQSSDSSLSSTSSSSASSISSTGSTSSSSIAASTSAAASSQPLTSTTPLSTSFSTFTTESTAAGGAIITVTSVVPVVSTQKANDQAVSNTSFFHNRGDVAGVFTVVGLVALGVIVAILTSAIRRRRAKKFDQDAAEAAADAAANAHVPDFADDEYGYPDERTQEFGGGGVYSDTASHGTYSQPPLQPGESYNMSELPPFDPYAAASAADDPYSVAGAAGIGAAGINRVRSMGRSSATVPYNAFAGPPPSTMPYYGSPAPPAGNGPAPGNRPFGYGEGAVAPQSFNNDLLGAPGLGGAVGDLGASLARGPSQQLAGQPAGTLERNKSLGTTTLGGLSSASEYSSSTAQYQSNRYTPGVSQGHNGIDAQPPMVGDRYAGHTTTPSGRPLSAEPLPNPFDQAASSETPRLLGANFSSPDSTAENGDEDELTAPTQWQGEDDHRTSLHDEDDYGFAGGRRVLKVANE